MIYQFFFNVMLMRLDAETAHRLAASALRIVLSLPGTRALTPRLFAPRSAALRVRALGMEFASPLGVASGLDKGAASLAELTVLGFGFVEVGTVTALAQPGNARPRVSPELR